MPNRGGAALMVAGALVAAPGLACAAPAAPASPAMSAPVPPKAAAAAAAPDPALAFYPAKAKADGVSGVAVLKCTRNEHLAVRGCTLVSETPQGEGFGDAALAMAAQARDNPAVDMPQVKAQPAAQIQVHFTAQPLSVQPDLARIAHIVSRPLIVTRPTTAQVQAAYPERALNDQVEGGAVIDCVVTLQGSLAACRVAGEQPSGYGFGQAALDLAPDFKMKPAFYDGQPMDGGEVPLLIPFRMSDPSAPLTLELKKPDKDKQPQP